MTINSMPRAVLAEATEARVKEAYLAGWRACREAAAEAADLAAAVDNGPDDYGDGMNRGASLVAATIRALEPPKVTP